MIAEICTQPAVTASPDTTSAQEAAQRMRSRKVGALAVINGGGTPVAVLTDRRGIRRLPVASKAGKVLCIIARRSPDAPRERVGRCRLDPGQRAGPGPHLTMTMSASR
jgi:CBS domain-containing protein